MISAKIKLGRQWQRQAAIRQRRIALPRIDSNVDAKRCSTSSLVEEGHFVVYSADKKRFVLPLELSQEGHSQIAIYTSRRTVWDPKQWTSHIAL
ncbi:hypothetical protein SLE2022_041820 [Rubroshorea leprosula]